MRERTDKTLRAGVQLVDMKLPGLDQHPAGFHLILASFDTFQAEFYQHHAGSDPTLAGVDPR